MGGQGWPSVARLSSLGTRLCHPFPDGNDVNRPGRYLLFFWYKGSTWNRERAVHRHVRRRIYIYSDRPFLGRRVLRGGAAATEKPPLACRLDRFVKGW